MASYIFAHGALFGPEGIIQPDEAYILKIQAQLIKNWEKQLAKTSAGSSKKINRLITKTVKSEVLANALYIDWLTEELQSGKYSTLNSTNNSLRWYYIDHLQEEPRVYTEKRWYNGIASDLALDLEAQGLKVFAEEYAGDPGYINDCISAGVPIPYKLFDNSWTDLGFLDQDIAFNNMATSQIRVHFSNDPPGFCLSVTRLEDPTFGNHFDMICFGIESNNACFFESDRDGLDLAKDHVVADLMPGEDNLVAGACTRCHIGENPFLIHPSDSTFRKAALLKGVFF